MSHEVHGHEHAHHSTGHKLNYFEQELQKPSLKEPAYKSKFTWVKPLSAFHTMEFKG